MQKLRYYIAKIMYLTTWPLWLVFLKTFLNYKVIYKDPKIKKINGGPVLIMANHITYLDPFLAGIVFPINSGIYPIRWITKSKVFSMRILGKFVWLYGGLKVERGVGLENALKDALQVLKEDGSVGIFPEGRLIKNKSESRAKRGVGYLAHKANPTIVPIYIDGMEGLTPKEVIKRKRSVTVYVGESFKPSELGENLDNYDRTSNLLMEKVHNLKTSLAS